jgi:hypothetical protein
MISLTHTINRFLLIVVLLCAVSGKSAVAQPSGRLVVLRSANFGWNIALNLKIDGRTVANVVQGRRFDRPVPAGRHTLTVSAVPNNNFYAPTSIGLNVQPGGTYVFTALWDSDRVVLRPSTLSAADLSQPL